MLCIAEDEAKMHPTWHFRVMEKNEPNIDPIQEEFFNTEALPTQADALIREAIQNSLDAAIPDVKVALRISFSQRTWALPHESLTPFFPMLWEHLDSPDSGMLKLPSVDELVDYLVLEDFGTRGLQGDPSQYDDRGGTQNDFYYFWRNVGRSGKGEEDLGRWGLGKNVFPASSRINSFFGLTQRADDSRLLLMGQSVLKIHHLDGLRHFPYGYYGDLQEGDFVMPIQDSTMISAFCSLFRLKRFSGTGLSIVIPFPHSEITPATIVASVVRQYFFPILSDELTVTVTTPDQDIVLDAETLVSRAIQAQAELPSEMVDLIDFAKWAWDKSADELPSLNEPSLDIPPTWSENLIPREMEKELRTAFEAGERIALQVPIWIGLKDKTPIQSYFNVFLQRNNTIQSNRPMFIREGITISDVNAPKINCVRSLVIVEDKPLAAFLGDSENPAHTKWQDRSSKFKGKYDYGPQGLKFVKRSVSELVKYLSKPDDSIDKITLSDIFFLPKPQQDFEPPSPRRVTGEKPGETGDPKPQYPPQTVQPFQITKRDGGFRVTAREGLTECPSGIFVRAAYEVRRGNPFKKYRPPDFQLGKQPVTIQSEFVKILECRDNHMLAEINDPKFSIIVIGFDPSRDLRVSVSAKELSDDTQA